MKTLRERTEDILQDLENCHEDNCDTCKYYDGDCALELVEKATAIIKELYNNFYIYKDDGHDACPECGSTNYSEMYEEQTLVYYMGPPDQNPNKRIIVVTCNNCGRIYSFEELGYSNTLENFNGREKHFLDGSIKQTDFLDRERVWL